MKLGLKGTFTLTVRKEDGSVRETLTFDNLITNTGMDRIAGPAETTFTGHALYNYCILSTNNTAPVVTDTTMGGTTVSTTAASSVYPDDNVTSGSPNYIVTMRKGWRFNPGVATGTWASIGMGFSTGSLLFCKTLIRSEGIPTTITILPTESLDIRYDLTVTPVTTDSSGTVTINGTVYNWTARIWAAGDMISFVRRGDSIGTTSYGYTGTLLGGGTIALGAITAGGLATDTSPPQTGYTSRFASLGNSSPSTKTFGTYVSGTYQRDITFTWSSSHVASGGVVSVNGATIAPGGPCPPYQFIFSPAIPKGTTEELSLTFRVSWTRL